MVQAFNHEFGGDYYIPADIVIINNTTEIYEAADKYDVDPYVLAGCIYVEQRNNYNIIDEITDVSMYFLDTSVGVSQIKISNVRMLENLGYIDEVGTGRKNLDIARKLRRDNAYNINCAAAYLSYLRMRWDGNFDVSKSAKIWGTLYNMGEGTPHPNPVANTFGEQVEACYWYMQLLMN